MKQVKVLISTDYPYRFEEGLHLYDRNGFNVGYADGLAPDDERDAIDARNDRDMGRD